MKTIAWLLALLTALSLQAGEDISPVLSPRLGGIMDACTFYLSFDGETVRPELAAGDPRPRITGPYKAPKRQPQFAEGLLGDALVLNSGNAIYKADGNAALSKTGAIALWVKPLAWRRPQGSNVTFLHGTSGHFYVQRQGPMVGKDRKILRHEHIQYLVRSEANQPRFTYLMTGPWDNGTWHLLVVNWAWPAMQFSVDGGAFAVKSVRTVPKEGFFGDLIVGSRGGDKGLLDEVMIFKRPLSLDEIRTLHDTLRPKLK